MVPNRSFKLFVALVLLVSATLTGGTASASPAARQGTLTDPTVVY